MMRKFAMLIACMVLTVCQVWAQSRTISGKVVDSVGQPMVGVTVSVKGNSKIRNLTEGDGSFKLTVPANTQSIVFSYVGFVEKTVSIQNRDVVTVSLEAAETKLEDVVVTGFQRISKKNSAVSSVKLKAEDIKLEGVTDVSRMLEGRAAGVSIQNVSSTFGSAPKVRIRGATSINGDNKPLWVVDGVVLEDIVNISNDQLSSGDPTTLLGSPVAGVNSNDIESIDILKDAAATALYGARAMNGVVVITTKKGRSGKTSINYTANISSQLKPTYADFNIMNSAQQMSVLGELERKGILKPSLSNQSNFGVYGKMYDLIRTYDETSGTFGMPNTYEARLAYLRNAATVNTDWFDILFKNSLVQEHSLSVAGGNDKSQSFFSTSFYNDNGWTLVDNVKRYTLNFRNNYKFSDRVNAGFLTTGSYRQQRAPGTVGRQTNPVSGTFERDFDINPFSYALNASRTIPAYEPNGDLSYVQRNFAPFNIIDELRNNYIDVNVIDLKLQGELNVKLTKNLNYNFIGAIRYVKSTTEHQITEEANMANAYRANKNATMAQANKFLYTDPDDPSAQPVVVLPYGGFYNRTDDQLLNYDVRNSLNYVTQINSVHDINILLGQQVKLSDRQSFSNTGYGYQYDNGGIPFIDYRILKQTIEANFPYYSMTRFNDRFAAFYLNAQYTYNSKFIFNGTVRYDGSNKLGSSPSARWLPTWTVGGAYNLEQEHFMQNVTWIDYLKLRASYGLTASLGPATNSNVVLRSQTTNRTSPTDRESAILLANLQNDDLTWEKNHQLNIGLDGGLFHNRLSFSVDVYQRNSFDLIALLKTPGIGGESYKFANYADMTSKGVDALLSGPIYKSRNFTWKTNLTFGYNTTKIKNAVNEPNIFDLVRAEGGNLNGYPVSSLFSIRFAGLDHDNGTPTFVDQDGKTSQDVDLQDQDVSNLMYMGSVDPRFTGGFSNTFTYKDFSLNVFLTYQAGNKIRLYPVFSTGYSDFNAMPKDFADRWEIPGDETITNIPSIVDIYTRFLISGGTSPYNSYNYSDVRVADGGFVRLKTVSLTYNVPVNSLKKIGFSTLGFTASAINPWLIYSDSKLRGQDPEFFNTGGVAQPIQKQYTLTIRAGL